MPIIKKFMVFWGEGYYEKAPKTVTMVFFTIDNGFPIEDILKIKELHRGESFNCSSGPVFQFCSVVRIQNN